MKYNSKGCIEQSQGKLLLAAYNGRICEQTYDALYLLTDWLFGEAGLTILRKHIKTETDSKETVYYVVERVEQILGEMLDKRFT